MKLCSPYLRARRRKTGGTIGLLLPGLLGLFFVMVGMRWAVVLGVTLLLVTDGDAEIDLALAPSPAD